MTAQTEMSAAELRRELRRQKILMRSDERMTKITGVEQRQGSVENNFPPSTTQDNLLVNNDNHASSETPITTASIQHSFNAESLASTPPHLQNNLLNTLSTVLPENADMNDKVVSTQDDSLGFKRARCVLCVLMGMMVRLSFCTSFGESYVQNIFNPFMAWEIAVIGYQHAIGMSFKDAAKKDITVQLMTVMGANSGHLSTFQHVMGFITALSTDFAFYFFTFAFLHYLL